MTTSSEEVAELREQLIALQRQHDETRAELTTMRESMADQATAPQSARPAQSSRRSLFKLAAGAAAGGAAAALATGATPVAANDNVALLVGQSNSQGNTGRTSTTVAYTNANSPQTGVFPNFVDANILLVRDPAPVTNPLPNASSFPAAVAGYAYSRVNHGVYGFSARAEGAGVVGVGGAGAVGVWALGNRANLLLSNSGQAPESRADAHGRGEIIADGQGRVWLCIAAGSPGKWITIGGPKASGAFYAIAPKRVYDSRPNTSPFLPPKAILNPGQNRVIDCTLNASGVPAGAKGVALNLTAAGPTGTGNLAVYPDGTPPPTISTLNYTPGVNIANSTVSGCGPGAKIRVQCGSSSASSVNFIVDILGYYL